MSPPEWAELARSELASDVSQTAARAFDRDCRRDPLFVSNLERQYSESQAIAKERERGIDSRRKNLDRIEALVRIAVDYIVRGAPHEVEGVVHRLAKFDTQLGLESIRYAATEGVPYAELLYERYLDRPFATHRDAVPELVGEVMESAVEEQLRAAGISYRKTKRAERLPGFGQAPDFCIPDEVSPSVVIEAKIASDDGTARDKVDRIKTLITDRNGNVASGRFRPYEVVACIDGRGFGERRERMRRLLLELNGKVFTTATLDQLIRHTDLRRFVTQ